MNYLWEFYCWVSSYHVIRILGGKNGSHKSVYMLLTCVLTSKQVEILR